MTQIEALDVEADDYFVIDRISLERAWEEDAPPSHEDDQEPTQAVPRDALLPPLHKLISRSPESAAAEEGVTIAPTFSKDRFTVVVRLDRTNPLTEARWVKTGDVEQWIMSLGLANGSDIKKKEQLSAWQGKIEVMDPDPVSALKVHDRALADSRFSLQSPTIQHALDSWATTSNISSLEERRRFVATHMSDIDNGQSSTAKQTIARPPDEVFSLAVLEILLRLTRSEKPGAAAFVPSSPSSAHTPSVGVLAATLAAPYPDSQTQVSLAVLAMFRLSVQTAEKAGLDTKEVHKQVADIVRTVPYPLQFRALDGMFKEFRSRKK